MLPDMQSGFCLEVFTKSKFFGQKLPDLGSVQNKLMQLKRVTRSVARGGGGGGSSPENSPPQRDLGAEVVKDLSLFGPE